MNSISRLGSIGRHIHTSTRIRTALSSSSSQISNPANAFRQSSVRHSSQYATKTLSHYGARIVPEQEAPVVERLGKYNRTLVPGFHFLIPGIERIQYVHSLKEQMVHISGQTAITKDNVSITIDGILYCRVVDPVKASYAVENPFDAVIYKVQTTMRSEIGKITLDRTFEERDKLSENIVNALYKEAQGWGMEILNYEIRDINPPQGVREAMHMQAEADRNKRVRILESEGKRQADINNSDAIKQGKLMEVEAQKQEELMEIETQKQKELMEITVNKERVLREAEANKEKVRMEAEANKERVLREAEANKEKLLMESEANKERVLREAEANKERVLREAEADKVKIGMEFEATAKGIELLSKTIKSNGGPEAAGLRIAEQYINAFGEIAKKGTTMLLPADMSHPANMMSQAFSLYKNAIGSASSGDGGGDSRPNGLKN